MSRKRANVGELDVSALTVNDLKKKLALRGLETSGKKAELVSRLEAEIQGCPLSKKAKVEASSSASAPSSSSVDYSKMTVADLKKELLSKDLKVTGKKGDLVERLKKVASGKVKVEQPKEEEQEESDFSKAKKALVAETESKKKTKVVKNRKVDSYVPGSDWSQVYEDWDCMLNQTNIGQNNNKFYIIQLLKTGTRYNLWTRWGRVGEAGQNCLASGTNDLEGVKKEFKKKFSAKTQNKWENRDNFKPVPGKYTLLEMDDDSDDDEDEMKAKLTALDKANPGPAPTTLPCTLDKPTQDLVKLLFNADMFVDALKSLDIDTKKMPLGKLSKVQIAKGLEALENIERAIDANKRSSLADLTSKFYTIIPHDFGRRVPPVIADKETLQKKFDMLLVLGDIEMAQGMQAKEEVKAEVTGVPHEFDVHYQSMNCDLTHVDPKSHEYGVISKYVTATSGTWYSPKIMDVWRVDRHKVDDRFKAHNAITNRRLLWHGTNVAVVAAILKSGLRIMPHSGGRVGKGIYLASENSKSAGYVRRTANNIGIMFLNEAALGKEHHITMDDWRLTAPPSGFDSIIAKGRTEPDSKDDIVMKMGGKDVSVPQGKPIPTTSVASNFSQSEYLVYKESQTRIRYLLKMKF